MSGVKEKGAVKVSKSRSGACVIDIGQVRIETNELFCFRATDTLVKVRENC